MKTTGKKLLALLLSALMLAAVLCGCGGQNSSSSPASDCSAAGPVDGTYTGTGQYGPEHPNTLTFDFAPRVVILFGYATNPGDHMIMIRPYTDAKSYDGNYTNCTVTWLEDGVQWYNSYYESTQFNRLSRTYYYIAVK